MDSQLQDLSPKPQSQSNLDQPQDQDQDQDNHPLLNPTSTDNKFIPTIEELDKKYAPYVRHDVYGTMGRGELPWTEKVLLAFAFVTLVPMRVVLATWVVVLYYLICRICTLFMVPNCEDEQEDYAHLGGWRRGVLYWSGRVLSRVMLFAFGFYWIQEVDASVDDKVDFVALV